MEPVDSKPATTNTEKAFSPDQVPASLSKALEIRLARTNVHLSNKPNDKMLQEYSEMYSGALKSLSSGENSQHLRKAITIHGVLLAEKLINTMEENTMYASPAGSDPTPTEKVHKELLEVNDFIAILDKKGTPSV